MLYLLVVPIEKGIVYLIFISINSSRSLDHMQLTARPDDVVFGCITWPSGPGGWALFTVVIYLSEKKEGAVVDSEEREGLETWENMLTISLGFFFRSIGNLPSLTKVHQSRNFFEGTIPSTIGKCKKLMLVSFCENNLEGSVPKELSQLSSLSVNFQLPISISGCISLELLELSGNFFHGSLPRKQKALSLSCCGDFTVIYLRRSGLFFFLSSSLTLNLKQ
ncbi:hypothetical protein Ccrd_011715, partial [Cynara cardunculus var. scolymus]